MVVTWRCAGGREFCRLGSHGRLPPFFAWFTPILVSSLHRMNYRPNFHRQFGILEIGVFALTGLAVVVPFLHFGIPSGHDFEFHFHSWLEAADAWRNGLIYPHWAALEHYDY